ncbi:MAG: hypothetical protein U0R49_09120 [Fimbriimonadales bacterium]
MPALKEGSKAKKKDMAAVSYKEGMLAIECGILTRRMPATGKWNGVARLPAPCLLDLAGALHVADPITISIRDGRLWIETSSWVCDWQTVKVE